MIDRARLTEIYARERQDFLARHPRSAAAYGRSEHLFGRVPMTWMNKNAERSLARSYRDLVDMGGVGGTLAGNPLSIAATRATLEHVLTDDAFTQMISTCLLYTSPSPRD